MNAPLRSEADPGLTWGVGADSPMGWDWPVAPVTLPLHDKYSNVTYAIRSDEPVWTFSPKGGAESITFSEGTDGALQRHLALLAAANQSASVLRQAASVLVRHWSATLALLATPPEELRAAWEVHATTMALAGVNKKVLKVACTAGVGHWNVRLLPLVKSLDTRANAGVARRANEIEGRQRLVPSALQAQIVAVLDAAALNDEVSPEHLDGAGALALIFQHGVRPVQALCLNVEHARFFTDASGELACVVSFHAAKQKDGGEFELPRQVKPEWVPIMARLHAAAILSGRSRLFETSNTSTLWARAVSLCKASKVSLKCSATALRHTGAQTLADAGHSRKSIKNFLGHVSEATATVYIRASLQQAELINTALGASKLYKAILGIATKDYVTPEEVSRAGEDEQIGGVVGESLVAGIGLCRSGQSNCAYNPVTSCYGCPKFMPSLDRAAHIEAVEGMRQQVRIYLSKGIEGDNPAYRQLTRALAGAQEALDAIGRIEGSAR